MKMKKRSLFIFVLISVLFLLFGCQAEDEGETEEEIQEAARAIVETVSQHLAAENESNESIGLSEKQLKYIKSYQLAEVLASNLESTGETGKVALGIVKGTLLALGSYEEDSDASEDEADNSVASKIEIIKSVNLKLIEILNSSLDSQSFLNYAAAIFKTTVSYLDSAGITQTSAIESIGELAIGFLAYAASIELSADNIASLAVSFANNSVRYLGSNGTGLLGKLVPQAVGDILPAIIEGLQQAGMENDSITSKLADIIEAAVTGLGYIPDIEPEDLGLAIIAVKNGVNEGLGTIGLETTEIEEQQETIDDALSAAEQKLADDIDSDVFLSGDALTMSQSAAADLIEDIYLGLFSVDSSTGSLLSKEQIDGIKEAIDSSIDSVVDYKLETVVELVFEKARSAVDDISPDISEEEKIDVLKKMAEVSVVFLCGKVVDVPKGDENMRDSLQLISEKTIDILFRDMTGDPEIFADIAAALVESMDVLPTGNASIADAAQAIIEDVLSAIDEIGLSEADQSEALNNALSGALQVLQDSEQLTEDEVGEAEGGIAAGVMENLLKEQKEELEDLLKAGDSSADEILADAIEEVMDAMKEAGASDVPELADNILDGVFDALNEEEDALTPNQMTDALEGASEKLEEALEEEAKADDDTIDADEQAEIDEAVKEMAENMNELISEMAPSDSPNFILAAETAITMESSSVGVPIGIGIDAQPATDIVVTIESENTDEGVVEPDTITFTSDNWDPQEVMIYSRNDWVIDGNVEYAVVIQADNGVRTTVMVTNIDDDLAAIEIDPFGETEYGAVYGGPINYKVRLKSQPHDDIEIKWALTVSKVDGQDPAAISDGRTMIFTPDISAIPDTTRWDISQDLNIMPAELDIPENIQASASILFINSVNGTDENYPAVTLVTLPMTILQALRVQKMEIETPGSDPPSTSLTLTFEGAWTDDDKSFYDAKIMTDQTIDLRYAENQTEPECLSDAEVVDSGDTANDDSLDPPFFSFAIYFYNTAKSSAEYAVSEWLKNNGIMVDATSGVCAGDESGLIGCNYSGFIPALPASIVLVESSIFNTSGVGNTQTCTLGFVDSDTGAPSNPGPPDVTTDLPYMRFQYDKDIGVGSNVMTFKGVAGAFPESDEAIEPGFWILDSLSSPLSKVTEPYDANNNIYLKFE